jgi:hypothetical protein
VASAFGAVSNFPNYSAPSMARTAQCHAFLALAHAQVQAAHARLLLPRASQESCCGLEEVGRRVPSSRAETSLSIFHCLGPSQRSSLAHAQCYVLPSCATRSTVLGAHLLVPRTLPGKTTGWSPAEFSYHCTMATSSLGIKRTLSSTFLS